MPLKALALSDLHNEFGEFVPSDADYDVVLLVGDIHVKGRGVAWAANAFPGKPVLLVPGNHDYYKGSLGHTLTKMRQAAEGTNVRVLNNDSVVIGDVRFVGATLWTDFDLYGNTYGAQVDARLGLNDYKQIRDAQYRKVSPATLLNEFLHSRAFIRDTIDTPFEGKTVVLTHHAPTEQSVPEMYRGDKLTPAYASNLEYLFGDKIDVWVHGHLHDNVDQVINGTRVLCNPRGYAPSDLNERFNPSLVLEL